MAKKKRFKIWLILFMFIIIILAVIGIFAQMNSAPPTIDISSLKKVERADIARSVVATGVVEPISNRIEIRSKASGIVKHVHVDVGDRVVPGQVLVELDRDQLQAQLREAEANLLAAGADVVAARAELRRNRILAEEYDVKLARANHNRSIELFEQNLISKSDFDITGGRLEEALNRQRAAAVAIGVTEASIAQKEARVAQIQAVVDRISEELNYTSIRSPIHGIVLSRDVETGSAVSSILTMGAGATRVMILGDMKDVYVRGQVNEIDIGKVKVGLPARITAETYKEKVFQGKVYKIAPLGVERNNVTSFEVRVSVDNPEGLLLANMSANAEIILEEHLNALTIPEGAVAFDMNKKTYVEVPDPASKTGRRRVDVDLGISTGIQAEILSGLKEEDQVILQ
ncbi:MAG: efflux RND transporter periplasmic adaptor subunit [Acidobacteriota bacterium]